MKIFKDGSVYVQKYDVNFLCSSDIDVPLSIVSKAYSIDEDSYDKLDMRSFIRFDNEDEINFFKKLDFILDYNIVRRSSISDLENLAYISVLEKNTLIEMYESLTPKAKIRNRELLVKCGFLDYKMYSINEALDYKTGELYLDLPKGVPRNLEHRISYKTEHILKRVFNRH